MTIKDAHPLNRMDAAFDYVGGCLYFTVLDMARGCYQIKLEEGSKEKTAFQVNGRFYQWRVMNLGLCNAPPTYTRLMELVLHGLTYKYCLVYLDDTIIFSRSFDEHIEHVDEVLYRIIGANLKLKPEKCLFAASQVKYLGFEITNEGIKPDNDNVKAINEIAFPRTAKGMVRFKGTVNFYRDFINKSSNTASILYKMSHHQKRTKRLKN